MSQTTIHAASWLINANEEPISGGAIAVQNGQVVACGLRNDLIKVLGGSVVDHLGCAIIPGFVNAHTHLELTHFPAWRKQNGMGYEPRSFVDWIIQLIKINRGLSPEQLQLSLKEGLRKSIQSGTTSVGDILSHYELLPYYSSSTVGGRVFFELLGHDPVFFNTRLNDATTAVETLTYNNKILPAFSPHSPYTINEEFLPSIRDAAFARKLPLAIHISESEAENTFMFDSSGPIADKMYPYIHWQQYLLPARHCSPTDYFDQNGLLGSKTIAVHCVHVNAADAQKIKQRGSTICICPRSNERLDVGKAPVALFKKLCIPLALGTDSLASNDSISLWDEMRFALDTFKGVLSPRELLKMATAGGALALHISDKVGSLAVGKQADFQIVKVASAVSKDTVVTKLVEEGVSAEVFVAGELYCQ